LAVFLGKGRIGEIAYSQFENVETEVEKPVADRRRKRGKDFFP